MQGLRILKFGLSTLAVFVLLGGDGQARQQITSICQDRDCVANAVERSELTASLPFGIPSAVQDLEFGVPYTQHRIAGESNGACCVVCRADSQACGGACVKWTKVCRVGPGCACQR